jgi:flagella basal body P-ring formation protein FlgA
VRPFLPALAAGLLLAAPAAAATLRAETTLDSSVVRLSDLFDDAGQRAGRVLGPGPAPGQSIVVEAPQLAAIARQFGVDWRPTSSADRSVLDWPGRPLPREAVMTPLRAALAAVGAPADGDVDLPGFSAPMIPVGGRTEVSVEQLDYDGASGRFGATLVIAGAGMPTSRARLSGRLYETLELPVPAHRLPAGSVVQASDLQRARVRADAVRDGMVHTPAEAVGMALKRPAVAGQPLVASDLMRPIMVPKGARVAMELYAPGLALSGQGVALEAGGAGDVIQVLNPTSRAVVAAEVVGPGRVRVAQGSTPLQPAGGTQVASR